MLRPYQAQAIQTLRDRLQRHRRVLLIAPTGSGKTQIFAEIVRLAVVGGRRVLIVAHRKELLDQASHRLGIIPHGFIKSGYPQTEAPVQIASVQTLHNRAKPPAELIILDEAHRAKAKTWLSVLEAYPNIPTLGFTATPWRLDGKALGDLFEDMVLACTPKELVRDGFLVPVTGFAYDTPDLSGVHRVAGEYNEAELAEIMDRRVILGNIVEQWGKHARELSTVVFATTIEHSKHLTSQFLGAGIRAEHIDGSLARAEREAILARVASGETRVICNVNILTEGTDLPRLKCCVMARPTMSLALYIQSQGRIRRPWENQMARIHDHAGNVFRHGLPDDDRDWSLEGVGRISEPRTRTCPICYAIFAPGQKCPNGCELPSEEQGKRAPVATAEGVPVSFEELRMETLVQWRTIGQTVEGEYLASAPRKTKWGDMMPHHILRAGKRDYVVPESADLRARMRFVKLGDHLRITYVEDKDVGKRFPMRVLRVERR